jgi:hypothetical protein
MRTVAKKLHHTQLSLISDQRTNLGFSTKKSLAAAEAAVPVLSELVVGVTTNDDDDGSTVTTPADAATRSELDKFDAAVLKSFSLFVAR